jgi:hypothetical protein
LLKHEMPWLLAPRHQRTDHVDLKTMVQQRMPVKGCKQAGGKRRGNPPRANNVSIFQQAWGGKTAKDGAP